MKIELVPVIKADKKIVDSLRVTKKQVNDGLIYSVPDALSVAKENPHKARPFFIELNGEIIGFTMFAFDEEIENENYRYWLWQLMIDEKHQIDCQVQQWTACLPCCIKCYLSQLNGRS